MGNWQSSSLSFIPFSLTSLQKLLSRPISSRRPPCPFRRSPEPLLFLLICFSCPSPSFLFLLWQGLSVVRVSLSSDLAVLLQIQSEHDGAGGARGRSRSRTVCLRLYKRISGRSSFPLFLQRLFVSVARGSSIKSPRICQRCCVVRGYVMTILGEIRVCRSIDLKLSLHLFGFSGGLRWKRVASYRWWVIVLPCVSLLWRRVWCCLLYFFGACSWCVGFLALPLGGVGSTVWCSLPPSL